MRFMHCRPRALSGVAAFVLSALPALTLHAADYQDRSVIGKWRLISVLDFATISALDDKEAKRLVGQFLIISADKVQLGTRVCSPSDFWAERVEPDFDLREKAHASASHLGLPNPVTVVELSCAYVYIKNSNRIVLDWNGAFFDAVRLKR